MLHCVRSTTDFLLNKHSSVFLSFLSENSLYRHNGRPFSTYDRKIQNDECADFYKSGWWFEETECVIANLNGLYFPDGNATTERLGIIWNT